jgi:hypothetical protein
VGAAGNLVKGALLDLTTAPDTLTSLYETPGTEPSRTFSTGGGVREFENPSLQVICRSTSYQTARNNADVAFTILDSVANSTVLSTGGPRYVTISADQSPFSIGQDDNRRWLISCNYSVAKGTG